MKKFSTTATLLLCLLMSSCNKQDTQQKQETQTLEENKKVVLHVYQTVFGDHDFSDLDKYMNDNYIQHNPMVGDGREAFTKAVSFWLKDAPKTKIDVQHIGAEGNYVYLHIKSNGPGGKVFSTMDIFRLENGKLAEHWDVQQEVPTKSPNPHPMF